MSKELATLFAKKFIQRPDVKAIQLDRNGKVLKQGDWYPDVKIDVQKQPQNRHLPHGFKMAHLLNHIAGDATYGHYLLGEDNMCKLFAFDIDLIDKIDDELVGNWVDIETGEVTEQVNPRELWQTRKRSAAGARQWYKYQMKCLAHKFATRVVELGEITGVEIGCSVAYSGSKGVHVYGFTGPMPAVEVREAANLVLDLMDEWTPYRGKNIFVHKNNDPVHGFSNFTVEVFPKQTTISESAGYGNLMRLPLGKNWKNPNDPTFFLDMTAPLGQFVQLDPVKALTEANPFA